MSDIKENASMSFFINRATLILLDNSNTSINADVYPSRLAGQLGIIRSLAQLIKLSGTKSEIGVFTLGSDSAAVRCSCTTSMQKVMSVLDNITSSGTIEMAPCIKRAIIALDHSSKNAESKEILILLASKCEFSTKQAEEIKSISENKKNRGTIKFNVVLIDPENSIEEAPFSVLTGSEGILMHLTDAVSLRTKKSFLSDSVFKSSINPLEKLETSFLKLHPDTANEAIQYAKSATNAESPQSKQKKAKKTKNVDV